MQPPARNAPTSPGHERQPPPAANPSVPPAPDSAPRSLAPDIARGLMLLLIALANVPYYLYALPPGTLGPHPEPQGLADRVAQVLMMTFVDHHIFPMFAFLFAYGMVQFYTSRRRRGITDWHVRRMLLRRHWAMLALGFLHAALLFSGDVLGSYAIAALLLTWLLFRRRTNTLRTVLVVLAIIGVLATVGLLVLGVMVGGPPGPDEAIGASPAAVGNYPDSVGERLVSWTLTTPIAAVFFTIPAMVVAGWYAARHRVLDDPLKHRRTLVRIAAICLPIGLASTALTGFQQIGELPNLAPFAFFGAQLTTGALTGPGYAALFGLLATRWPHHQPAPVRAVAAMGRRSLTFYLAQSIIMAPLLSAWGLGLGARLTTWSSLLVAAGVWLVCLPVAAWMGRRGMRGPFETVLRALTYGHHDEPAGRPLPGDPATGRPELLQLPGGARVPIQMPWDRPPGVFADQLWGSTKHPPALPPPPQVAGPLPQVAGPQPPQAAGPGPVPWAGGVHRAGPDDPHEPPRTRSGPMT